MAVYSTSQPLVNLKHFCMCQKCHCIRIDYRHWYKQIDVNYYLDNTFILKIIHALAYTIICIVLNDAEISKKLGQPPYFHLDLFMWIFESSPCVPVNTVCNWRIMTSQIQTVQIGGGAIPVPPSSFSEHCTTSLVSIMVSVSCWESKVSVIC